jgi:hypothetical protein
MWSVDLDDKGVKPADRPRYSSLYLVAYLTLELFGEKMKMSCRMIPHPACLT